MSEKVSKESTSKKVDEGQNQRVYPMHPVIGVSGYVPNNIKGLNWGAFLLPWIWGPIHRTWWALLAFVPILGIAVHFLLLFKGNDYAWDNNEWSSPEAFKASQNKWIIPGIVIWLIAISLNVIGYFI